MKGRFFPAPSAGDIVLCHFPYRDKSGNLCAETRPVIVIKVIEPKEPQLPLVVEVVEGTTNRDKLRPGEFEICRHTHPLEFARSGLLRDTKFMCANHVKLPYTDEWFQVPPHADFGQTPKVGTLHPETVRRFEIAYRSWLTAKKTQR